MATLQRYTTDELTFIAYALELGVTKQDIAAFFGVTRSAITWVVRRHKLEPKKLEVDLDEVGRTFGLLSADKKSSLVKSVLDATPSVM